MSRTSRQGGFSILEAMLAVLVLMMGVVGITQLTRSMTASIVPSERGVVQHPEIVDQLLRDQVERLRAGSSTATPITGPVLVMSEATYSARADRTALDGPVNGFSRATYTVTVEYQAPGAAKVLVGSTKVNKVVGPTARGGL